jgi:hypothetical protein
MQICKRYITKFENYTSRNVEGPILVLGWAFHILGGTIFNYYKIQVNDHPRKYIKKNLLGLYIGERK